MSANLEKVNHEISEIRSKQTMMSTMETRKTEEQKMLADSMNKPAEMLEQMKTQWETILSDQQSTMRDLVSQTVSSALLKAGKVGGPNADDERVSAQTNKFFEQKIKQFEVEFEDKENAMKVLRSQRN